MAEASMSGAQAAARIEGALARAVTYLEEHNHNSELVAELTETRELLRHHVWLTARESSPRAIIDRIHATVGVFDTDLARYLATGSPAQSNAAIGDAITVAELVSGLAYETDADNMAAARRAGRLVQRLLGMAHTVRNGPEAEQATPYIPANEGDA